MLEAAGCPVAVNPEAKLAAIARKRGWHDRALGARRRARPCGRSRSARSCDRTTTRAAVTAPTG